MLPLVRLQRPDSERSGKTRQKLSDLPVRTEESIICGAVTLPSEHRLPYEFEMRGCERVQFTFRAEFPLDVLFARMSDYEAWVSCACGPAQPLLVYAEALETLGHAMEFVAPEDGIRRRPSE